jgi:hypothetical protein
MAGIGVHQAQVATFRFKVGTGEGDVTGTAGAKTLFGAGNGTTSDGKLPDNAVITRAWLEPITALAGGAGATVKLGITGNDDAFLAATLFDDAKWVPEEPIALTAEVPLKTTAAVAVLATVAVATLTAGEFDVHVEYLPGR